MPRVFQMERGRQGVAAALAVAACVLCCAPTLVAQTTGAPPEAPAATTSGVSPQQQKTAPSAQEQPEAPASAPVAQEQATPNKLPVPKAVPSMMPSEPGSEIDRVVALVNGQIVLDSDVNEERRFEVIQPYPNTSGEPTLDQEIERLINRALILQQARLQSEIDISDADVDKEVEGLRRTLPACKRFGCESEAGWQRFLASNGFSASEFRGRWKERMEVLAFIQERFGAGTTVSSTQIREFYQNTMLPQYKKAGVKPASLTSVEGRIRDVLQQQQVSNLLRDWLQSLRAQGSITVMHPGEEAP